MNGWQELSRSIPNYTGKGSEAPAWSSRIERRTSRGGISQLHIQRLSSGSNDRVQQSRWWVNCWPLHNEPLRWVKDLSIPKRVKECRCGTVNSHHGDILDLVMRASASVPRLTAMGVDQAAASVQVWRDRKLADRFDEESRQRRLAKSSQ